MALLPSWMRPPPSSPDGTMALIDHLRELRYRVFVSVIALLVFAVFALIFYNPILKLVLRPYLLAREAYIAANPGASSTLVTDSATAPFTVMLWVGAMAGVILSCPVWLYQLWAYIAPALLKNEKKLAVAFLAAAIPLFLGGVALGYIVLPKGIEVLLAFTPTGLGVANLLPMKAFLDFELKMMLVFGLSFLLPVVLIGLNLVGVLKGYQLAAARKFVVFGTFVFAAVATPSADPFSMLALSLPMVVLYFISEGVCRFFDKRRGITKESVSEFAIDVDDGK